MPEQITLYTAKVCPYAHRVELALEEANAAYTKYQIDLSNKPEWYAPKVNPASKVPAVAYGGPAVPADQPSPESQKLAESLILVEFVADLYPSSNLLPSDPMQRARARFFIDAVSTKFSPAWGALIREGKSDPLFTAIEALQALLPAEGYALGEQFSVADIAILPFFARLEVALKNDIGGFAVGEGPRILEVLKEEKYARFRKYFHDLKARPSFAKTFDEEHVKASFEKRFAASRVQK